jgi:flavin reductase (DIM6/NTAB) family NADH-FMN oxidoreductase RutF
MPANTFDSLMKSLDPELIVVTTAEAGEQAGCLVGFHCQSSMQPQRYAVWLSKANHTFRVAQRSTHLAIHFLTSLDHELAQRFGTLTGDRTDKFAGLPLTTGPGDVPILADCPNWLAVRRLTMLDEGGDHVCVVTEPLQASSGGPFRALRLSNAGHLPPGHASWERPDPPTERAAP